MERLQKTGDRSFMAQAAHCTADRSKSPQRTHRCKVDEAARGGHRDEPDPPDRRCSRERESGEKSGSSPRWSIASCAMAWSWSFPTLYCRRHRMIFVIDTHGSISASAYDVTSSPTIGSRPRRSRRWLCPRAPRQYTSAAGFEIARFSLQPCIVSWPYFASSP